MHLVNNSNPAPVIVSAIAAARSRSAAPMEPPRLLVVDDSRMQIEWLCATAEKWGCKVVHAQGGSEALAVLQRQANEIDLIVLDQEMPDMSGLELLGLIHSDPECQCMPIIMLTGSTDSKQLQNEINAGVFYHLLKPVPPDLLRCTVAAALREIRQKKLLLSEISRHSGALRRMESCTLKLQTMQEAEDTACLLAQCFPQPLRAVTGLMELLINAVEHGNLAISYAEKTRLLKEGKWHQELERRMALPEYRDRRVRVTYQRKSDSHVAQITDDGQGFNWHEYWNIDPAHATSSHGRGIPRARLMGFDRLVYNQKGNQVTVATLAVAPETLKW